jgi:hypothetical protein
MNTEQARYRRATNIITWASLKHTREISFFSQLIWNNQHRKCTSIELDLDGLKFSEAFSRNETGSDIKQPQSTFFTWSLFMIGGIHNKNTSSKFLRLAQTFTIFKFYSHRGKSQAKKSVRYDSQPIYYVPYCRWK